MELRLAPPCAVCGQPVGKVEFTPAPDKPSLRVEFVGIHHRTLSLEIAAAVEAAIRAGDVRALHALHDDYAAFYCPRCDASYCERHWRMKMVFAEDDPDWLDETAGTCPRGHARTLWD